MQKIVVTYFIEGRKEQVEFVNEQDAIAYKTSVNSNEPLEYIYDSSMYDKITAFEYNLIDLNYIQLPLYKLDFTKHLTSGMFFKLKHTEHDLKGRPIYSDYSYKNDNDEYIKIVRQNYYFQDNEKGLMINQKWSNQWYLLIDPETGLERLTEEYIWDEEDYMPDIYLDHRIKGNQERVQSREFVLNRLKTKLQAYLESLATVLPSEVLMAVINENGAIFETYANQFSAWLNTGYSKLAQSIQNDTVYNFLNSPVPSDWQLDFRNINSENYIQNYDARAYIIDVFEHA